jgi:hypothetical protein
MNKKFLRGAALLKQQVLLIEKKCKQLMLNFELVKNTSHLSCSGGAITLLKNQSQIHCARDITQRKTAFLPTA